MDLLGKALLNDGDDIIIKEPGYLGAIQAFSMYQSSFHPVPVSEEGSDLDALHNTVTRHSVKLFYCVPNFQDPSGISYSEGNCQTIASLLKGSRTILMEDDLYGELRFLGKERASFYQHMPEHTVMLGSFSKIVAPAFRIGWIVAHDKIKEKLVVAKQASDLHTNYFCQRIIHRYLKDYDIDEHINKRRQVYGRQRDAIVTAIQDYFPAEVLSTHPEGGMFLGITLPKGLSAMNVFKAAIRQKVAFVPGDPFYVNRKDVNALRLNYSSVDEETIMVGIKRLSKVLKTMITEKWVILLEGCTSL
jgi:2-aminoadipate transaminase